MIAKNKEQNHLATRLVYLTSDDSKVSSSQIKGSHDKIDKVVLPSDEFSDSYEETIEELNGSEKKGKNKKVSDIPTGTADRTFYLVCLATQGKCRYSTCVLSTHNANHVQ